MPHRNLDIGCVHLLAFEEHHFQTFMSRLSGYIQDVNRIDAGI